MFTFAAEQRLVPPTANPVIGVKKPTKEASRDRVLTHEEVGRIWDACETQSAYVCAWFRLRLVTAQRGGELLQTRWQDLDKKSHFWSIPGEFVKNAHGHRVYLSDLARKGLETVPRSDKSVWVFPKSLMGDHKHIARRGDRSGRTAPATATRHRAARCPTTSFTMSHTLKDPSKPPW